MRSIRREFGDGKYYVEIKYRESTEHVCGLKLSIVIHDIQNSTNVCRFDDSHRLSEGVWPFHRHTETGRHYILTSSMKSAGPNYLFLEVISFVLKEVADHSLLSTELIPCLAGALTAIWIKVIYEEGWT